MFVSCSQRMVPKNNITTPDYRENKLFLDDDAPLRVRLYAAIRDGWREAS